MPYPQHKKLNNNNDDIAREMLEVKSENPQKENTNYTKHLLRFH